MQAFVPKTRKPKFDLTLRIIDLSNVPLVSGTSLIKWHLPQSTTPEHRGRTHKCAIKEHKVVYDYEKRFPVRLTVDKNGMLQESIIHFEIIQEYSASGRGERITLGYVKLNLAEFIEASETENDEVVTRRYLMQDSKVNSTLKVGILMKQTEGDKNFIAPPLKSAPVFGGIAGIMVGDQGEHGEEDGHMPSLSKKSRETGELQDMYRRSLAAFWSAQPGELKADECVEDIFAGGDGWGDKEKPYPTHPIDDGASYSDDEMPHSRHHPRHRRHRHKYSGAFSKGIGGAKMGGSTGGVHGRGSLEQSVSNMKADAARHDHQTAFEVDELEIRENLRSWRAVE